MLTNQRSSPEIAQLEAKVGPTMTRYVGLVWGALTVLGSSASAWADDAAVGSSLQAGGLRPPEAVNAGSNPAPSQTEANLELADREDSGRGLEFVWLNAEAGPEYLGLETLRAKGLVDSNLIHSKDLGMAYGAGLGVRLLAFTFGARFRFGDFPDWQTWSLNAEAGLHLPLGQIEPYFALGGGYASLGAFDESKLNIAIDSAHGVDLRGGFGVDVYLSNTFSVGGNLTGDVLFLSRSASISVPLPANAQTASQAVYAQHGSGIGAGATLSAVLGLHF
jgi:hypothetical protein